MAKPLDPKAIEVKRQTGSRAERREQKRRQMQDEISYNQRGNGKFLHCLPATRGEDVTDEVADSAASLCWEQAGNRLTAMRGLLVYFTRCRPQHTELEEAAAREQLERFMADRGLS